MNFASLLESFIADPLDSSITRRDDGRIAIRSGPVRSGRLVLPLPAATAVAYLLYTATWRSIDSDIHHTGCPIADAPRPKEPA